MPASITKYKMHKPKFKAKSCGAEMHIDRAMDGSGPYIFLTCEGAGGSISTVEAARLGEALINASIYVRRRENRGR